MYNKINNLNPKSQIPNPKLYLGKFFFGICFLFIEFSTQAQCAMCRAAIESEGNGQTAAAINDGIVYLMAIPYILVGVLGFYVYRLYAKRKG